MYIIAGLGNPGREYEITRHNIGFHFIDYLADKCKVKVSKLKFRSLYAQAAIGNEKVILLKPQTYMNLSGEAIRDFAAFYKLAPENIIVICDDINLDRGNIRIRPKGSDGGHNGLKSIIYQLKSDGFVRIKMGVGANVNERAPLADYVLGRFGSEEIPVMEDAIIRAADAVRLIVGGRIDLAMNKYNQKNK